MFSNAFFFLAIFSLLIHSFIRSAFFSLDFTAFSAHVAGKRLVDLEFRNKTAICENCIFGKEGQCAYQPAPSHIERSGFLLLRKAQDPLKDLPYNPWENGIPQ